jgi:hypothetical protein
MIAIKTIELRNVKFAEFASHETNCFSATVYVNGERAFLAENDGNGGCDNYHSLRDSKGNTDRSEELLNAAEKYAESLPDEPKYNLAYSLEFLIDDLFSKWLEAKEVKRLTKNGKVLLFRTPDMKPDVYKTSNIVTDASRAHFRAKYPGITFLNDEPMPQPIHTAL